MTPTCRQVSEAIARGEKPGLLALLHLSICDHCRKFRRQIRLIETALGRAAAAAGDIADLAAFERSLLERLRAL